MSHPLIVKTIIVGAHYDVHDDQMGADDNASAIAGLLELAKILKSNQKDLRCNIEFVAYTLEEPPFFRTKLMGSYIHMLINRLFKSKQRLHEMVIYDFLFRYYKSEIAKKKYKPQLQKAG